jgi:hypothetical protein
MYKIIILPCFVKLCNLISLYKGRSSLYENRVLRMIFGPNQDEVAGGQRKLHMSSFINHTLHHIMSGLSSEGWQEWGLYLHGRDEEITDDGCFHCENCVFVSGIVPKKLLNLLNGFNLSITKLLAKFNAITLLISFCHFVIIDNPPSAHNTYTFIDRLPAIDAFGRRETIHGCA